MKSTRRSFRRANATGRSEGLPRFVQLPFWLLESPAFLALSSSAKCTLLFLTKRFNGVNNGHIGFGVRSGCFIPLPGSGELVDRPIGLAKSAIARSLKALEAAGFIRCTKDATFDQKRLTREWRLTWIQCSGCPATKDFMSQGRLLDSKASPRGETIDASTVPPAAPPPTLTRPDSSLQARQRDYEAASQSRGGDTSSNHTRGITEASEIR
jgi:hypothetical protein